MRSTGTVKWFNLEKGYGFITPDSGNKDVFVHISAVRSAGVDTLNDNQKVEYDIVKEKGRESASNISLV
ncbi:MAG: CspA family cold shock protein [Candidatus Midichloriaceae bacterium]|jgi:CspA family cold shock protein